ncbi:superfamily I DNA and/or RNA helicase [Mycoplasmopsis mustelae]|uniref:Superfamily I DNA and/or RNA helicase n=1 Tax=Mycoplasmopsis mustelae TaxID=171289 RepID=A0A4R7UCS4_9BACT|nr:ATP-binding protein [Mycoplasmopsis mustelae]TDV23049.1 superfamily I DNA and/or RNA helicase [Mycoplasmopsis mustelae]
MINNKYQVILDNLLDISPNDSSIFTRVNDNFIDLYTLLRFDDFKKIVYNEKFEVSLLDGNLINIIENLKNCFNFSRLREILDTETNPYYKVSRINFNGDFQTEKQKIINFLEHIQQKSVLRWKILDNKVTNILDETNTWPLHIGFLFVSLRKEDKTIYAPLFFKEAEIRFKNAIPYLSSDGDVKLNEKVLFFLNNSGFNIHLNDNFKNFEIQKLIKQLKIDWENLFTLPTQVFDKFHSLKPNDINNENITFHPGTVLGIFQPWGGYSRNRMKEIINNNEMESILEVEFNKNVYKNKIQESIFRTDIGLFNVTKSNFSQDKAIISSLNQNTVIWGPPGTGKSQTIVNLITNILIYGYTVIVASQKKAALDVIKERLGSLSHFCLFLLSYKNVKKKSFYQPIREYLDLLENFDKIEQIKMTPVLKENELKYVRAVNNYLDTSYAKDFLNAYYYLFKHKANVDIQKDAEFIFSLPDISYPSSQLEPEKVAKAILKENNLRYLPFLKKYWTICKISKQIEKEYNHFNGSLYKLVSLFNQAKQTTGESNFQYSQNMLQNHNVDLNQEITDSEVIKQVIIERMFERINKFTPQQKQMYSEFSQSVRIQNLEPYRFVKKYAEMIKLIYPVIIATPDTDLSAWNKEEFDYAILDESSQIFIEKGLPILYLAKTKILAGDREQMRPSNWFGTRNTDDTIFGKVESLLDYAISLGVYQIILDKNYRANHASLMTFSSKYFYNSSLDVIDNADAIENQPIEVHQVDGVWENNHNKAEAEKAIDVLLKNIDNYKKIILLAFNAKQSDYLTNLIYSQHPGLEQAIYTKKLLIRNIENIQGDEADLVVATVAYDKNTKLNFAYVSRSGGKNALNVAISRAKEKMIVIKTIKASEVQIQPNSTEDLMLFKKWLSFLELDDEQRRELHKKVFIEKKNNHSENQSNTTWFKELVSSELQEAIKHKPSYELFKKYNIGSFDIDLVITKNQKPYKCILFDTLDYGTSDLENYAIKRDKYRFLKAKKYDVIVVTPLNWIELQNIITLWFNSETTTNNKDDYQPTNTYLINKTNIFISTTELDAPDAYDKISTANSDFESNYQESIQEEFVKKTHSNMTFISNLNKVYNEDLQSVMQTNTQIPQNENSEPKVAVIGNDPEAVSEELSNLTPIIVPKQDSSEILEEENNFWKAINIDLSPQSQKMFDSNAAEVLDNPEINPTTTKDTLDDLNGWILSDASDEELDVNSEQPLDSEYLDSVDQFTKTLETILGK